MIATQDVNLEEFRAFCQESGIDPPCFFEKAAIYLATRFGADNSTFLEVGSGYGRLVPFLSRMCMRRGVTLSLCEPDKRYADELTKFATRCRVLKESILDVHEKYDVVLAPFAFLLLFPHDTQRQILEHMLQIGKRVVVDTSFPCEPDAYVMTQEIVTLGRVATNTAYVQPFSWYKGIAKNHKRSLRFFPYFQRNRSWLHVYVVFE